jgi:MFS family permease
MLADNLGRKRTLLISFGIATFGMAFCASAWNIYVAGLGLFIIGFGCDTASNICFYFIT